VIYEYGSESKKANFNDELVTMIPPTEAIIIPAAKARAGTILVIQCFLSDM
jgi:hypothetical protein